MVRFLNGVKEPISSSLKDNAIGTPKSVGVSQKKKKETSPFRSDARKKCFPRLRPFTFFSSGKSLKLFSANEKSSK